MSELEQLSAALSAELRRREVMGLRRVLVPEPVPEPEPASGLPPDHPARSAGDLESLRSLVAACTACELCQTRTQTVFQDGTGSARVLFVGEAPGQNEDEQGIPFVGRAGALLTDIIEKGMGLARSEVTIANVLKCRPPANRDPSPAEKALCTPFLDRQIELLDPAVIVTLGLHASQHILKSTLSMGRLRGRVHTLGRRKVVATYHPAYLLRSPGQKKECWKDIQLVMAELGLSKRAR
jgi:uracil-DNA glycosylase family 4